MNTPQIFEPQYYQRLYDIEEQHWWAQGMRDAMIALLREPLADKQQLQVLDVGCGTGYLLEFLKQHYPLDGEPVGVDVSPHALKFCELRGAKKLVLGSAVEVPLAAAAFDLIICIDTIQHLSPAGADQTAIAEFARLLKPGGLLYLRTNSSLGRVSLEGVDVDQYRRYDLATVKAMLTEAGLKVKRATYLNALPGALAALREFKSALSRPTHKTAAIGPGLAIRPYSPKFSWLNHLMHGELAFEAWLIGRLHLDLPFGHSSGFVAQKP